MAANAAWPGATILVVRSGLFLGIAIVAAACGGQSPSAPAPATGGGPGGTSIQPGAYTVTMAQSTGLNPRTDFTCFIVSAGSGGAPDTLSFPATVTAQGTSFVLRPEGSSDLGWMATLQSAGAATLSGPMSGQVRDPDTGAVATFSQLPAELGSGRPAVDPTLIGFQSFSSDRNSFAGHVTGSVNLALGSASRLCTGFNWMIRPR